MSVDSNLINETESIKLPRIQKLMKKYCSIPDENGVVKWYRSYCKLTGRLLRRHGESSWHIEDFAHILGAERISSGHFRELVRYEMNEAFNKIIKDKINACKAELSDILHVKLTKTINYEKAERVQAQIRVLESLLLEV